MGQKKYTVLVALGSLISALSLVLIRVNAFPDSVTGFGMGAGIGLMFLGLMWKKRKTA